MARAKYEKYEKGGYWTTKVWDGTYNADGTKHRKTLYSRQSSRDLENKVNALRAQVEAGTHQEHSDWLFRDYARHWLEVKKSVREENTRAMYDNIIEKHFAPLADVPLADIRNSHLQLLISATADKPRTCQQIYVTFKQVIRMAVADSYINAQAAEHVVSDISLPTYQKPLKRALTSAEKDALQVCFKSGVFAPRERAFLTLIYYCGLRKGEALALSRFDCDLGRDPSVSINKSLIFSGNRSKLKAYPKTARGIRSVPLPKEAGQILSEYCRDLSGTVLFPGANMEYISKSSYDKMWASIVRKLNAAAGGTDAFPVISDLTAHIFRHNYCSNLCYKIPAISIGMIARLLGDTEKMVVNVYSHVIEEKEDVAATLEDALSL